MTKEKIASIIIIVIRINVLRYLVRKIYILSLFYIRWKLKRVDGITIYLKNNIHSDDFEVGVSDLDFFIIVKDIVAKEYISDVFDNINKILPFIKDHDVVLEKNANFLTRHGKYKYRNYKSWKRIYGSFELDSNYIYYPLKFFIEQIHELFFALNWLNFNFQKYKVSQTIYRKAVLRRTIRKVYSIVEWIKNPEEFIYSLVDINQGELKDISNSVLDEKSLAKVSSYLQKQTIFDQYGLVLPQEFERFERAHDYILSVDFNHKIKVAKDFFVFEKESENDEFLSLGSPLFNLIFKTGSVDPRFLDEVAKNSSHELTQSFIKMFSHTLRIESHIYREQNDIKQSEINEIDEQLHNGIIKNISNPLNLIGETVYITVNWGYEENRYLAMLKSAKEFKNQKHQPTWIHLSLCFPEQPSVQYPEGLVNEIKLKGKNSSKDIWLKECLFNIAIGYCFMAKNYILADADIYAEKDNWLLDFKNKLDSNEYDFVHGFSSVVDDLDESYNQKSWTKNYLENISSFRAPGLVWGIPNKTYRLIRQIPDIFPDGSNDGAFIQELTGKKMGNIAKFNWYKKRIRPFDYKFNITYLDHKLHHVNHGPIRDYINRAAFLNILNYSLEELYEKNTLGVFNWKKDIPFEKIMNVVSRCHCISAKEVIAQIDELIDMGIMLLPEKFMYFNEQNIKEVMWVENGIAVFKRNTAEQIEIHCSKFNKNSNIECEVEHLEMLDNEHVLVNYTLQKPKGSVVKGRVYFDAVEMEGVQNLYDENEYLNTTTQPLAYCYSSWGNNKISYVKFHLSQQTGPQVYGIRREKKEHINLFHAWNTINTIKYETNLYKDNDRNITIPLEIKLKKNWFMLLLKCESDYDGKRIKLSICTQSKLKSITSTRMYQVKKAEYIKVAFAVEEVSTPLALRLELLDDFKINQIELKLHERKKV